MSRNLWLPTALLVFIGAIIPLFSSCSSTDMALLSENRMSSRPTDCFPTLAAEGDVAAPTVQSLIDEEAQLPVDLSGTWAVVQIASGISNAPVFGEVRSSMANYQVVQWTQRGNRLDGISQVCTIDTHSSSDAGRTVLPRGFIEAIGPSERLAVLEPVEGGIRFRQALYIRLLGIDTSVYEDPELDPATFEIPDDSRHPAVVDADGDGNPGITVNIEGILDGEVYIAQRHMNEFCGDLLGPDRIEGFVYWETEQRVLGASNFILNREPVSVANPDWNTQWFIYSRVPEGTTCEELLEQREAWFGEAVRRHVELALQAGEAESQ